MKPKVIDSELLKEISLRSGIPEAVVLRVVRIFSNVVKQCVASGVEVSVSGFGVFGYRDSKPNENKYGRNPITGETYYYDKPGWYVPVFRASPKWKDEIKEKSLYGFDEEKIKQWKEEHKMLNKRKKGD